MVLRAVLLVVSIALFGFLAGAQTITASGAPPGVPSASGFLIYKFPTGQVPVLGCTGVGFRVQYFDRDDCGFGVVTVTETTSSTVVKGIFVGPNGSTFGPQQTMTFDENNPGTADDQWQFDIVPDATWPAGDLKFRVNEVAGTAGNYGEVGFFHNKLGADIAVVPGSYAPGDPVNVAGNITELNQATDLQAPSGPGVPATFSLRVVLPDGTVRGPYAAADPAASDGSFTETLPAAATAGLTAGPETNYEIGVSIEVVDVAYTDPLTGAWAAARAGSTSLVFRLPPTALVLDNSFVSAVGWVKPDQTYPFRVFVKNFTGTAPTGASVTIDAPDGTTFTNATTTSGTAIVQPTQDQIVWTIGTVPAAGAGGPTVLTLVGEGRADYLAGPAGPRLDPEVVWKNLSSRARLTYAGLPGSPQVSISKGPKVIPPNGTYDSARYGYRPFPVVPVDWRDRKHEPAHTGEALSDKINSPSVPGSTFNLYQEMSFNQLFPDGTVPSAGIATRDFTYGPGFNFTTPQPQGTCKGTTLATPPNGTVPLAGTPVYPERIQGGWYQMPGDTEYYGGDRFGSALPGAIGGVGLLMDIDSACGPTGKAVYDAAQIADPEIDYSDYDTDKDGVVDFFMMVFVGLGGNGDSQINGVPPYDNIWPHSSSLEFYYTDTATGQKGYISDDQLKNLSGQPLYWTDGDRTTMTTDSASGLPVYVRVGPYNVNPESAIDNASVISHEYGHSLGLPDYYSLGGRETYGDWNLMATDKSHHMDAVAKKEMGWLIPRVLEPGQNYSETGIPQGKIDTNTIVWKRPDGTQYTLTGSEWPAVHNGRAYAAKLPARQIIDPAKVPPDNPPATTKQLWWSGSGNDFGCPPVGGHNLDIALPELASLPAGAQVRVTFMSLWDIEWDYDYGFVMTSRDNGTTYQSLPSDTGTTTPQAINPTANACQQQYGNGITGSSGSYPPPPEQNTANVDRLAGNYPEPDFQPDQFTFTVTGAQNAAEREDVLRFSYATDPGLARPGWFIDNLKVEVISPAPSVIFETDFAGEGGPDDPRMYSGGCKGTGTRVAGQCTDGWNHIDASAGSPAEHLYIMEMRDRNSFDLQGRDENDREPIAFLPGFYLGYTDEAHGYGNVGTDNPPAQSPLDSQPTPGSDTPNLNDAAWTDDAGDNTFSDSGTGHVDNYSDPRRADGLWRFDFNCLTFNVLTMSGDDVEATDNEPGDLTGNVNFTMGPGCGTWDYGYVTPVPDQPTSCLGLTVTIQATTGLPTVGTAGNDVIIGTLGNDNIDGGGGRDLICGLAGNDTIVGGTGNDSIEGGPGDDPLTGGDGFDAAYYTTATGPVLASLATGGATGGAGTDSLSLFEALVGSNFGDTLTGDGLRNNLFGEGGIDTLNGGGGNDGLDPGTGSDEINGGDGFDVVSYFFRKQGVKVTLDNTRNDGVQDPAGGVGENDWVKADVESVQGGQGNDHLIGNNEANNLFGHAGNDTLEGLGNATGIDGFDPGLGDDFVHGGSGFDIVSYFYRSGNVTIALASNGNTTGNGLSGENDTIYDDVEGAQGGSGNDTITGSTAVNILNGQGGNDNITSRDTPAQADTVRCGAGTDTVTADNLDVLDPPAPPPPGGCENVTITP